MTRNCTRRAVAFALATTLSTAVAADLAGRLVLADPERHEVVFVDLAGRTLGRAPTGIAPRAMALRDGQLFVAAAGTERAPGATVTVVDLATSSAARTIFACENCAPRGIALDGQGTLWLAAQSPPSLVVLRPPYARAGTPLAVDRGVPAAVATLPDGRAAAGLAGVADLLVADAVSGRQQRIDVGTSPELVAVRPGTGEIWTVVAPEGRIVAFRSAAGPPAGFAGPAFPRSLAFTPDGRRLLVTGGRDKILAVFDPAAAREISRSTFDAAPEHLAVSPDGRHAAVLLVSGEVVIVALETEKTPARVRAFTLDVEAADLLWVP